MTAPIPTSDRREKYRPAAYRNLHPYFGDLHNHCGISYGHGSLREALSNAQLQLDFVSITGHAHWADMPRQDPALSDLVKYHVDGFQRLAAQWDEVQEIIHRHNKNGRFVAFPSIEWHSMKYGDYCIYFKEGKQAILRPKDIANLRRQLRTLRRKGREIMLIPHHIGYRPGFRGISWEHFTSEFSPVVEMISMHGCAESDDAPRPFLHVMGPRNFSSTVAAGLKQGHRFGFIGSTDHHSAHPGSNGHGRVGVWAAALDRDSIWDAIQKRQVYAATGERMELAFQINDCPMGGLCPTTATREIAVSMVGGDALDYLEVVRNGDAIYRLSAPELKRTSGQSFFGQVALYVGWGEIGVVQDWDVEFGVKNGILHRLEPRFRGPDIVKPTPGHIQRYAFSSWKRAGPRAVQFQTCSFGNPTPTTDGTQGFSLEIEGNRATSVYAVINKKRVSYPLSDLLAGSRSGYLGGFTSGAYQLKRAVPWHEYACHRTWVDRRRVEDEDYYYVRVRQKNDQWAWSSPIWVTNQVAG